MAIKLRTARLSAVLGTVCALAFALPAAPAQAEPTGAHDGTLAALRAFQAAAGPGAGILAGDATGSWNLSAGTGTVGANAPVRPSEHFRMGSQTKSFTAATALTLVDEGRIALDTPIETYLPGVVTGNGYDGRAITVRQLLQHTSGIADYNPFLTPPAANPDGSYALEALVREGLRRAAPTGQPGAAWGYSNTNYLILGLLIERTTGTPVHRAVTDRVVRPLGLTGTSFPAPGDRTLPTPAVRGYHGVRIGGIAFWSNVLSYDPSVWSTAGAMISTLDDLTAFYQALAAGRIVSPATLAEMERTVPVGAEGAGMAYGLGLIRHTLPCGGVAWGHDGIVPGYYSQTLVTADGRHASVVTNAHLATNAPIAQMYTLLDTALCESPGSS
jgi:D-alanyl-D-alanine carboxypeptidase